MPPKNPAGVPVGRRLADGGALAIGHQPPLATGSYPAAQPDLAKLDSTGFSATGICETPTGHCLEPEGPGPDGMPSWLRALRLI